MAAHAFTDHFKLKCTTILISNDELTDIKWVIFLGTDFPIVIMLTETDSFHEAFFDILFVH